MNSDDNRQLWAAFLSGELDPAEEAGLIRQLEADPAFLSDALQDAELDSLLRELGRGRQDDEQRFVTSVLGRLETRRLPLQSTRYPIVPPPRVLPLTDDAHSNELSKDSLNDDSVSEESLIPIDYPVPPQPAGTDTPDSDTRIWWTLVAPLAAVTLIAITIAMIRETGRVAKELEAPDSMVPILPAETVAEERASQTSTAEAASRRTILAENDGSIPAADRGSTDRIEDTMTRGEVAIGDSKTDDPSTLVAADPDESEAGPIINGFAVLTDSPSDVLWYHRPRPRQQGESLSLQRGTVEFQFPSGATVRIEAPAEFEIDSANSLLLARGCVSADVPQRAIGFTIDTPTVQIVDLGTRFDTQVSSSGTVGLHVREGKVLVKSADDTDETPESWVVGKDEQKFVESDGTVLDWKVEVTANVFGEITISVNGQSIPVESADDIEAIAENSALDVIRTGSDTESFVGRYVFNDHVQDYDIATRRGAADTIAEDIAGLADIARRAEGEEGFYHVKDKQYPYSGLRDKLEARRKIARVYGPRALGGHFWPREKFETIAGDPSSLDALQRKLIARLDFVDLGATSLKRSPNRRNTEFEVDTPAVAHQDASSADSDKDGVSFDRQPSDERNDLFRKLEEMRRRKGRVAEVEESAPSDVSPPENQTEEDASEGNLQSDDAAVTDEQIEPSDASPAETSSTRSKRRTLVSTMSNSDEMVAAALEAEMLGQQKTRQGLLGKVLRDHPTHQAANWQSGRIFSGRDWLDVTEAQERAKSNPLLASYERMRDANDGSVDGNLKLARWCRTRRPQASRMYYARLLDHPQVTNPVIRNEAAKNLELVSYRGQYFSKSELSRREQFERRYKLASRRWDAPLERWAKWLRPQSRDDHKQQAIDEFKEADDPDIALIASRYASYGSETFGVNVVETVGRFSTPESTQCLARYGVNTMWPRVRQASTIALRDRELHDYVPELLGSLIGMTKSEGKVERLIDGTIRFEHVFRQEGATTDREQRTTRNAEPRINFSPVILGSGRGPLVRLPDRDPWTGEGERIERGFFTELARRDVSANAANAMAQLSNERVYRLLSETTGQKLPNDTIAWWTWWQDYNGIEYQKSKKTYLDHDDFAYTSLDFGPRYQRRHSCFAAGTLVATETGMRPIEEIVAGDRVFAKHAGTGELKLQTVLVTTVRPPTPILELRINDETIRTTPGHPFWVTGKGWRMAKLLQEGDQLHGMRGVLNLEQIRPLADPEPVHNLIVDEFGNYFAGSSMALVHDNTFRRPTPALIPGLRTGGRNWDREENAMGLGVELPSIPTASCSC